MGKVRNTIGYFLDRNWAWAYQEIIAEALVVLWFSLHITLKLGTRVFPEWRNTRIDPDSQTDFDKLLRRFGWKTNGCAWDEIASEWMVSSRKSTNQSDTLPFTAPSGIDIRGHVGYVGTIAAVCATVLLSISVGCYLFANRNWRYPVWTQHIHKCEQIRAFIVRRMSRDSLKKSKLVKGLFIIGFLAYLVIGTILIFACFFLWLALWALPVILMAVTAVWLIVQAVGREAVVPCCVLSICLLSIYCTGRIWGWWMKDTYFSCINNTFRRIFALGLVLEASAVKRVPLPAAYIENQAKTPKEQKEERKVLNMPTLNFKLCVVFTCCLAVTANVEPISDEVPSANSSVRASEFWERYAFGYKRCYPNSGTGLEFPQAMLSHWMDIGYPRWNTSKPALTSLFASTFSPDMYIFLRAWIAVLFRILWAPYLCLLIWGIQWLYKRWRARRIHNSVIDNLPTEDSQEQSEQSRETVGEDCPTTVSLVDDAQPGDTSITITMENTIDEPANIVRCCCPVWASLVAILIINYRRYHCWANLPYPLVQLFVPEPLQLWALLLLLTIYGIWMIWKFVVDVRQIGQEQQPLIPPPGQDDQNPCFIFMRSFD
ncbi:uncharacterized protein LOC129596297 [Paramacrobiotus metropolitanus]|uniref:uncharacterized protein LOC129596297 n=1 Tax=Paramacrobiotus metropolitanus TaxID=2943436 RepID=UPI00244646DE|nr:uncharacterized protein LOC129596297 [Paramacrobiotus metropolitanus]